MENTPVIIEDALGYRSHCWFCSGNWGGCKCDWPEIFDDDGEVIENNDGFDAWGGQFFIVQPNTSECTRFYVNPSKYYGMEFVRWWENHPKNPTPCDDHCREGRPRCRHGLWREVK